MGNAGRRLVAVAGWGLGGLLCVVMSWFALYGLLVPECVTDPDSRAGRLGIALTAVFVVAVIATSSAGVTWLRRNLPAEQRFFAGPVFAASLVLSFVLWLPVGAFLGVALGGSDAPDATASCF